MAKKKKYDPSFPPLGQARMSDEERDRLFVHVIRRRGCFEDALDRLPLGILKDDEEARYRILLKACHNLAKNAQVKPGDKQFRGLLKDEVRKIAKELDGDEEVADAAEQIYGDEGFIDEAYAVDKADLSDDLWRSLLKRYLREVDVVRPLEKLLADCGTFDQVPKDLPEVLEKLLERTRKHEGIDAKPVKTFEEEWEEHEKRLEHYRGREMIGLKTGQKELDKRMLGLRGLILFGAKPGAGKTTYACVAVAIGVCRHHADNECVVLVISLDMDRFELYRRVHSNLGGIEWVPLMFGSAEETREPNSMFSKGHNACLKKAKKRFKEEEISKRMIVTDRTVLGEDITVHRLTAIIDEHKVKVGAKRALLIIDYLQLIPVPDEVSSSGDLAADKHRIRVVQRVIERTRTVDNPLGDTALVISEARKPPSSKEKDHWGDSMSELMGSARLGYAADAVLLYREMSTKEMGIYTGAPRDFPSNDRWMA